MFNDTEFQDNGTMATTLPPWTSYHQPSRMIAEGVIFILAFTGNTALLAWMVVNKRVRFHSYIISLAVADLSVALFGVLGELIREALDRRWLASDGACRVFTLVQVITLLASNYMIAAIAVDRYHSLFSPLKKPLDSGKLICIAWTLACIFATPQLFIFQRTIHSGVPMCLTTFGKDAPEKTIYIVYATVFAFFIPFSFITFAYVRIVAKLWNTRHSTLPDSQYKKKTRVRTLKMTCAIIMVFILCGFPYFATELYVAVNPPKPTDSSRKSSLQQKIYGVFSILAVSNSAVNPYIFFVFYAFRQARQNCVNVLASSRTRVRSYRAASQTDNTKRTVVELEETNRAVGPCGERIEDDVGCKV
ncbi:mesotocin receptor-like [Anneissia japonica]|uniref:mesotocin receptor-like n=1 Tax=Anneissia japonica TaxID=1529436 RepID=UPI0014259598|nr:mesotocin receptor-like [Anneissia japonica]